MNMEKPLKNKSALVTGSTSGLGKGIAQALAAAGCNVMLSSFDQPAEIGAWQAEWTSLFGVQIDYHSADLAKPAKITELMARTISRFGGIDILINNAGLQFISPIDKFPEDKWELILAVNLSAAFHTTKAALPDMRRRGWGRIINIASAHGLVGSPLKSAYVASKHGLVGLTKATALEAARDGITCNALCPGFIHTNIVDRQIDDQTRLSGWTRERIMDELILSKHPTKEFVRVEDVAAFALFLCSDAGAAVTGTALSIDGGWVAT
jgi:3-hydroxybutyrate dehydrogenase